MKKKESLIVTILFIFINSNYSENNLLKKELVNIYSLEADTTTSKELIESKYLELIKTTKMDDEKGLIYFYIAKTLKKVRDKPYDKIIEYSKSALQYPLEIEIKAFTYDILVEALSKDSYNKERIINDRKEIAITCLNGLSLLEKEDLPKEKQDLPGVPRLTIAGPKDDPDIQRMYENHEQQLKKRKMIKKQNTLIMYRDSLIGKCISIYSYKPYANEELRSISMEILNDEDYVNELMEKLNEKIQRKEEVRKKFEKK